MRQHEETADARVLGQWLIAVVPALMLAVLLARPTTNSDLFWQLKLGELALAQGGPVLREPFSAPHLGEPTPTLAWAGQALMALAYKLAGWPGLRLLDAASWCGGFWAVAAACKRRGASALVLSAMLALSFLAALPTAILRPQSYAVLCFGLLLALLRLRLRTGVAVLLGVPLLLAWQNLHPSVGAGALVLGAVALAGWLRWWRDRARPMPLAETILAPCAALALFATPDGWSILATSARNSRLSVMVGVGEWLPLWSPINHALALPVLVVAALCGYAVWLRRERIEWSELAVALALFAMTVVVYRFVVFWAISLIPLLARTGLPGIDTLRLRARNGSRMPARRAARRSSPRQGSRSRSRCSAR